MREILLKCSRCHEGYPSKDMRYISSNVMCCKNCVETPQKAAKPAEEKKSEKFEFRCSKCKYTFKRNIMPNSCPYCAKKDTLVLTQGISANKFLED